jgi:hypothetical protein
MSGLFHRIGTTALVVTLSGVGVRNSPAQPSAPAGLRPPTARHISHAANDVWIPGFWDLRGNPMTAGRGGWVYVPGQWATAPVPGARWVEGEWAWRNDWWTWVPGRWEVPRKPA